MAAAHTNWSINIDIVVHLLAKIKSALILFGSQQYGGNFFLVHPYKYNYNFTLYYLYILMQFF